jgi:hypothetical protein
MRKAFKTLPNGDYDYTNNKIDIAENDQEIGQRLKLRLKRFLGEWFLNNELGIPYFEEVLVKNPDLDSIKQIFRKEIEETEGVLNIIKLNTELIREDRKLKIDFTVKLNNGTIIEDNIII